MLQGGTRFREKPANKKGRVSKQRGQYGDKGDGRQLSFWPSSLLAARYCFRVLTAGYVLLGKGPKQGIDTLMRHFLSLLSLSKFEERDTG